MKYLNGTAQNKSKTEISKSQYCAAIVFFDFILCQKGQNQATPELQGNALSL